MSKPKPPPQNPAPAQKAAVPPVAPAPALWRPDWRWHVKTLAVIYVGLAVVYFIVTALLSRAPAPYGLREIPQDITPWLKK
jgi:hypothetical protein